MTTHFSYVENAIGSQHTLKMSVAISEVMALWKTVYWKGSCRWSGVHVVSILQ